MSATQADDPTYKADVGGSSPSAPTLVTALSPRRPGRFRPLRRFPSRVHRAGLRPMHWGATAPLGQIVMMVDHEIVFHTGELNMLLSIARGEAWEYTEEVEEHHIDTYGHGVRTPWMSEVQVRVYDAARHAAHKAAAT